MYRVSIELYKHEWKFGRTRNAVGTRTACECGEYPSDIPQFSKLRALQNTCRVLNTITSIWR